LNTTATTSALSTPRRSSAASDDASRPMRPQPIVGVAPQSFLCPKRADSPKEAPDAKGAPKVGLPCRRGRRRVGRPGRRRDGTRRRVRPVQACVG
jgi:hypothetical protein